MVRTEEYFIRSYQLMHNMLRNLGVANIMLRHVHNRLRHVEIEEQSKMGICHCTEFGSCVMEQHRPFSFCMFQYS